MDFVTQKKRMKSINLGNDYNSIFYFDQFELDNEIKNEEDEINILNQEFEKISNN